MQGTEGAETPFFSPDGQWIGFFADGMLKKVSVPTSEQAKDAIYSGYFPAYRG